MIQNSVKFEVCVKEKIKNFSYLDIENTHSLVIKNQKQKTQNESVSYYELILHET